MIKTTLGVEGMMCNMCEAHVNDAIRNAVNPTKVKASHKDASVEIISDEPIGEEKLRGIIDETGYKFVSFKEEPYEKKKLIGF